MITAQAMNVDFFFFINSKIFFFEDQTEICCPVNRTVCGGYMDQWLYTVNKWIMKCACNSVYFFHMQRLRNRRRMDLVCPVPELLCGFWVVVVWFLSKFIPHVISGSFFFSHCHLWIVIRDLNRHSVKLFDNVYC